MYIKISETVVISRFVARFNILVSWKICASKSLTFHILNVGLHYKKRNNEY